MKFGDQILTTIGPGLVVAAMPGGQLLASVVREETVEVDKKLVVKRYCPHRVFSWCETHQVWFVGSGECPRCGAAREAANGREG